MCFCSLIIRAFLFVSSSWSIDDDKFRDKKSFTNTWSLSDQKEGGEEVRRGKVMINLLKMYLSRGIEVGDGFTGCENGLPSKESPSGLDS